jgi:predicted RNase H-like nuclease
MGFRLAEYQLFQHNIRIPRTPNKEENCPAWMRVGFSLYQRLQAMGYQDYWVEDAANQLLEVYPHAAYSVLLERIPLPKRSLEGRLQRQLALHSRTLDVPDPMRIFEEITRFRLMQGILPLDNLHTYHALEALVAAFTAWAAAKKPDEVTLLGDAEEGQVVLPAAALKPKY